MFDQWIAIFLLFLIQYSSWILKLFHDDKILMCWFLKFSLSCIKKEFKKKDGKILKYITFYTLSRHNYYIIRIIFYSVLIWIYWIFWKICIWWNKNVSMEIRSTRFFFIGLLSSLLSFYTLCRVYFFPCMIRTIS